MVINVMLHISCLAITYLKQMPFIVLQLPVLVHKKIISFKVNHQTKKTFKIASLELLNITFHIPPWLHPADPGLSAGFQDHFARSTNPVIIGSNWLQNIKQDIICQK
jgi:hypothetical protein